MAGTPKRLPQTAHVSDMGGVWAAVSHFQFGSLSRPAGPLLSKDLINPELALTADHSFSDRSPIGQIPACSSSEQSVPWVQTPLLWPMRALPAPSELCGPCRGFTPVVGLALSQPCFPTWCLPSRVSCVFLELPLVNLWLQHIIKETRAWY